MKKLFMLMAILMVAVIGIAGCGGSSATKDGTLGSSKEEITKVYGQGKAIGRGFEFNNGTYIGFYKGLAAEAVDRNNGLDNKDSVIYKMLPADAKEVPNADVKSLKKDESYTTVKAYSSKSLSEKRKNDPAFKDYNIVMIEQQTMKGKKMARLEWLFDYNDAGNNSNNNNKAASSQPAPKKESSSFFGGSVKEISAIELVNTVKFDSPASTMMDKKVKINGTIIEKYVDDKNGKPYLAIYHGVTKAKPETHWNNRSNLPKKAMQYYLDLDDYIVVETDIKTMNAVNPGMMVSVTGTVFESGIVQPTVITTDYTDVKFNFGKGRLVKIKASKVEY